MTADITYPLAGKRVWVAGHRGMVGSAVCRALAERGDCEILTATRADADLTRQAEVEAWLDANRPDAIFLTAAKVGGILANASAPADFLYENLMIEANVIHAAHRLGTGKLLFVGSSCIYPKFAPQPIPEDSLLTGPLEPSNEWYAIAKIAGVKLCEAYQRQHGDRFVSAMPTNLYGPNDNFDLKTSHVLPALLRKAHEARLARAPTIGVWGSGTPQREFMHVDDLASALVFLMERYEEPGTINVGVGSDVAIRDLVEIITGVVGYEGEIEYDSSKPDGTPRKLMDSARLTKLGWSPSINLQTGVSRTYAWYLENVG